MQKGLAEEEGLELSTPVEAVTTHALDALRISVFRVVTLIYGVAPLIGEYAIYAGSGHLSGSLTSSLTLSISSALTYIYYYFSKNFKAAAYAAAFFQLGCYSWGLFYSGGIRAEHFFYLSLFPVTNGFLLGRRAAFFTTLCALGLILTLAQLEYSNLIPFSYHSLLTVTLQAIACLSFIGWIIIKYEELRQSFEDKLLQALAQSQKDKLELQAITDNMLDGLVIRNSEGKVVKCNPAALRILNLTADQLINSTTPVFKKIIKEDGSDFKMEDFPSNVALRTGQKVTTVNMGYVMPDGQLRWICNSAVPIETQGGRRVILTFSDVTNQVKLNKELKYLFKHTEGLMCVVGKDGFFKRISPSFSRIFDYEEQDLLDAPLLNFVHPDDIEDSQNTFKKMLKGFPVLNFEQRFRCRSGEYKLINWVAKPDPENDTFYASGTDITELRASENRSKELFKAIDRMAIIAITDANGIIKEANDNFCTISGYSREELLGRDHRIINSGGHTKSFFKNLWETIKSGNTWSGDIENRAKDGRTYFVRTVITPLMDINGEIEQYISVRFDVTEQKKNEARLSEAQKTAKVGSWDFDFSTYILNWSAEHYNIFEIEPPPHQEVLYQLHRDRIHKEDLPVLDKLMKQALIGAEDFVFNHRLVFDNGNRIKYVQSIGKVQINKKGQPISISGTCQDLSELVKINQDLELERAKSIKNAKLASLGEMSAGIAHEINNPLAIISGSAGLLGKFVNDPQKLAAKIENIQKSAERIARIVNGLRKFARSGDKSQQELRPLLSVVQEALVLTEAKSRQNSISIELSGQTQALIRCNEVEIEQVLINLINNAIDAVKTNAERWIKIFLFEENSFVVLRVMDSGTGIPENVRSKLFDPFFTTKKVGEGTGLGLSITKGILDEHNASISLVTEERHTCFEIKFPKEESPASTAA